MRPAVICEVCVDSPDGARAAEAGGADRVELCAALELGGLTPSAGLLRSARRATTLPIFAMVRPRAGDFVVHGDVAWMLAEIAALRDEGVDGLVLGALTPEGDVDVAVMSELIAAAGALPVTFHRAFDCARDPIAALDVLARLGVARVLTSGGEARAIDGVAAIRAAVDRAAGRLVVMAGAGVREADVRPLVDATGVTEVHLSAVRISAGPARFANPRCGFGAPGRGELERRVTDVDEVRRVVRALRS